jgi:Domain of unknown function (DUF4397)
MNIRNLAVTILALCAALTLASCGGNGNDKGGKPQIRLLNLSAGYPTLDMMTNLDDDTNDDDVTQASAVALEAASPYATLAADKYTIKLRRTGSGSVLRSFTGEQLVEGTINTYVAYGEVGAFGALLMDDTLDDADAGESKLSVANVSSAGSLDVYLTDPAVDLNDTTPTLSSVGATLAQVTLSSGNYRLRVTAAGDTTDVRLDVATLTLANRGVATVILTSTQGGMLANAIYLPQAGQPTKLVNTKARLRGAVGVADGASASIQMQSHSILSAATAGVIGSKYTLLDAGTVPVTLTVNGVAVATPDLTLQAGADYTLLVWSNSAGTQTSLIVDDNRLPTSGGTKLRLLNGMSTLAAPLTLSVDFSPLIEGTLLGAVSDEVELAGGTDRQIDITNTSTAANVLSRTSLTLQNGSIYTFFITDNGPTAIGVLRRDR